MNTQKRALTGMAFSLLIAFGLSFSQMVSAQTAANADAVYNGWLKAYLVQSNGETYFANSLTNRGEAFMWQQAYLITAVEDEYDRNPTTATQTLITDLLNRFEVHNGADISWDSWNDDTAWAVIALFRGYQITGNKAFLNDAAQAWNMGYNRGWDSTYGGGIWENMYAVPSGGKDGLSNWNFVFTGVWLYQATGDSSYLTKAKAIYAWARANVYDTTSGRVYEGVGPNGRQGDDNYYNSGLIVEAANALYKVTNTSQYYNDVLTASAHVINKYPILTVDKVANGDFGGDQFFRGIAEFARQNNLWSNYSTWLTNNATASWNHRRTDYNITANNFNAATTTGNLDSMESLGSVVVQAVSAPSSTSTTSPIAGVHTIVSAGNGIVIDNDNSKNSGVGTVEWVSNGGLQQKWLFSQNADGSWTITSQFSGLVLDDPGFSTVSGKQMQQYTANGGTNQKWSVTLQSDGSYVIVNKASNDALDNSHTTTDGQPLIQFTQNGTINQHWFLQ